MTSAEKTMWYTVKDCSRTTPHTECSEAYQNREMNEDHINPPCEEQTHAVPAFEFTQE